MVTTVKTQRVLRHNKFNDFFGKRYINIRRLVHSGRKNKVSLCFNLFYNKLIIQIKKTYVGMQNKLLENTIERRVQLLRLIINLKPYKKQRKSIKHKYPASF